MKSVLEVLADEESLVLDGVSTVARSDPGRLFLTYGDDGGPRFTYGQFDTRCRRVANRLAEHGLKHGDRVSVFAAGALTAAGAMFGLWRGGLVYAPVNYNLAGEALRYQLGDTDPAAVVCDAQRLPALLDVADVLRPDCLLVLEAPEELEQARLHRSGLRVLRWEQLVEGGDDREPSVARAATDVANLIYTSGTTGRPKGVIQSYQWMNQYTLPFRKLITSADVIYNDLPLYHVGGALVNVARAAWAGAAVALWDRFSPERFWSRVGQSGATTLVLLDVMIPWLMSADASKRVGANTVNKVQMQPLPLYHHDVAQRFGIDWVTVGFGQTESGLVSYGVIDELPTGGGTPAELRRGLDREQVHAVCAWLEMPLVDGRASLAKGFMGRELPYQEVRVADAADGPVGLGETGQLLVRGRAPAALMSGYLNKPEATAEALRGGWFHTGDLVYRGEDRFLYFVDRHGDRIRCRGENVSSLQVEDLLTSMPSVAMCAVVPVPAADGLEDDIAAFVVPADGAALTEAEVLAWAREQLPGFMCPHHIRVVEALPRTPTNKVEKYRLREALLEELGLAPSPTTSSPKESPRATSSPSSPQ